MTITLDSERGRLAADIAQLKALRTELGVSACFGVRSLAHVRADLRECELRLAFARDELARLDARGAL